MVIISIPISHLDHEGLWVNNTFAVQIFKILMHSIQVSTIRYYTSSVLFLSSMTLVLL